MFGGDKIKNAKYQLGAAQISGNATKKWLITDEVN